MSVEFSDAWVFASIVYAGGTSDLARVIGIADMIDHAIMTYEEIAEALPRLVGAGLLEVNDGAVGISAEGRALVGDTPESAFEFTARLGEALGATTRVRAADVPIPDRAAFEAAVRRYVDRSADEENSARFFGPFGVGPGDDPA
jgi:hypothetical protein